MKGEKTIMFLAYFLFKFGNLKRERNFKNYIMTFEEYILTLNENQRKFAIDVIEKYKESLELKLQKVSSAEDVVDMLRPKLENNLQEESWIVFLNESNMIKKIERIGIGGINSTIFDVRVILRKALLLSSSKVIMVHNHPSQNCKPSSIDDALTDKIKKAVEMVNIKLLDHIIICNKDFYSYMDNGRF